MLLATLKLATNVEKPQQNLHNHGELLSFVKQNTNTDNVSELG